MNSFRTAKMGIFEGVSLLFAPLMARILIASVSIQLGELRQIIWLQLVVNSALALLVVFMMIYVIEQIPGDIFTVCRQLSGKVGAWIIMTFYAVMFFGNSAILLRQYTEYTLITALPRIDFQMVVFWFAITVGLLCYFGIEAIVRSGCILVPFVMVSIVLVLVMLSPFYIVYNLTPWQGNGIIKAVQTGFGTVGLSFGLLPLVFLAKSFQNAKTLKYIAAYSLFGVLLLKVSIIIVYIMVFGTAVGAEKAVPFFEMVRLVYINEFIQRIEALFIVVRMFVGHGAIAIRLYVGLYLFAMLFRLPVLRAIVPVGVIIITNLAILPPDVGTVIQFDSLLLKLFNVGMYVFPTLLFVMTFIKNRGKKSCASG